MTLEVKLREEIVEAQRIQSELSKWKLILLAGIAATALGSVPGVAASAPAATRLAVLALLPFVCLYADTLNFHAAARIMKIAQFFRTRKAEGSVASSFTEYERWCRDHRKYANTEPVAMFIVSEVVSAIVFAIGVSSAVRAAIGVNAGGGTMALLTFSGGIGAALSVAMQLRHLRVMRLLNGPEETYPAEQVVSDAPVLTPAVLDPNVRLAVNDPTAQSTH